MERPVRIRKAVLKGYENEVLGRIKVAESAKTLASPALDGEVALLDRKPAVARAATDGATLTSAAASTSREEPNGRRARPVGRPSGRRPGRPPTRPRPDPPPDPSVDGPPDPSPSRRPHGRPRRPVMVKQEPVPDVAQLPPPRPTAKARRPRAAAVTEVQPAPVEPQVRSKSSRELRAEQRAQRLLETEQAGRLSKRSQARPSRVEARAPQAEFPAPQARAAAPRAGVPAIRPAPRPAVLNSVGPRAPIVPSELTVDTASQRVDRQRASSGRSGDSDDSAIAIDDRQGSSSIEDYKYRRNAFSGERAPKRRRTTPEPAAENSRIDSPFLEAVRLRLDQHVVDGALGPGGTGWRIQARSAFNEELVDAGAVADRSRTRSELEKALLPDPSNLHVDWIHEEWNVAYETQFRAKMGPWATAMVQAGAGNEAELWLWRLMIHFFNCMPHELFRYGLRVDSDSCMPLPAGSSGKSYNMGRDLCLELAALLCHPVWENDVAKLRFSLQLAVCARVERHVKPLAKLDSACITKNENMQVIFAGMRDNMPPSEWSTVMADYHYQSYRCGGVCTDTDIGHLRTDLAKFCVPRPATSEAERSLFLLQTSDVAAVRRALDGRVSHGRSKWLTTAAYCASFAESPAGRRVLERTEPLGHATLGRWKHHCFLAYERERWIRNASRRRGAVDDRLLDTPRSDPLPYHLLSTDVTDDQRAVLMGLIYPPDEEPLRPRAPAHLPRHDQRAGGIS